MTEREAFEQSIYQWEAHEDWRYADREAERKWFWQAACAYQRKHDAEVCRDSRNWHFISAKECAERIAQAIEEQA